MWIWILLLVFISIYNTAYGFLSDSFKAKIWVKALGYIAAGVLLIYGVSQTVNSYINSSSAYITSEGNIISSHNFPWKIVKTVASDGNVPVYIIEDRYGDSSEIKIKPDRRVRFKAYNSNDGVGVKFFCKFDEVPNFKITISP
ncbi:MAG: hypothetical protein ABSB91_09555 [Sedimentisphaerales bacterium]